MPTDDGRNRRGRRPSAEERDLWHRAMRDAEPIRKRRRGPAAPASPESDATETGERAGGEPAPSGKPEREPPPRPRAAPPGPAPRKPEPPLASGRFADLDRRTAERLRRGQLAIDARLDLHGMTQAAAQEALQDFVVEAAERGRRCVLVITGKGSFSAEGGVLRRQVPRWLNMPGLRPRIVAIAEAQPRHGGAGALYVLLKRRRG